MSIRRPEVMAIVSIAIAALLSASMAAGPEKAPAPALPPNTWVNMRPGGVVAGNGVGDEGFSTFAYSPGLGRGVVFGQYHAVAVSWGEDQNALLGYDFAENRWDVLEVTEAAWSEFLPGVGHDEGNATIDPVNDLYITRGNMTLHGNTAYQTYVYDLKAGRGKRMMPPREPDLRAQVAMAFSPDHGVAVMTRGPSWFYRPQANVWAPIANSPSLRFSPGLTYDRKHRVFVMFGGGYGNETWTLDPATSTWVQKNPSVSPPPRNAPNIAYDDVNGIVLLVGGIAKGEIGLSDVWVYDAGTDTWLALPATAPAGTNTDAGNNLIYDSRNRVFLLKPSADLRDLWAFRYSPSSPQSDLPGLASAPRLAEVQTPESSAAGAEAQTPESSRAGNLPLRTWVARPLPGFGKGPTAGKHQRAIFNPEDRLIYFAGGDWGGPGGMDSGRNEIYSYSVADNRWKLEYPYCGAAGEVQPSHPDEVGWFWDTRRRLFWMIPGYMGEDTGRCTGRAALVRWKPMTYDPREHKWAIAGFDLIPHGKFAVYDPVTDSLIRFYFHGGNGLTSQVISLATGASSDTAHRGDAHGKLMNDARLGDEYSAIDLEARRVWVIEPHQGRLYRYDIDKRTLAYEADTPINNPGNTDYTPFDCAMPIWNPVEHVLLWPHIPNFSRPDVTLFAYDPRKKAWQDFGKGITADGQSVRGNVAVLDPIENVLVLMGRSPNLFLFRYGERNAPG